MVLHFRSTPNIMSLQPLYTAAQCAVWMDCRLRRTESC